MFPIRELRFVSALACRRPYTMIHLFDSIAEW
jgi:hypothetical protein